MPTRSIAISRMKEKKVEKISIDHLDELSSQIERKQVIERKKHQKIVEENKKQLLKKINDEQEEKIEAKKADVRSQLMFVGALYSLALIIIFTFSLQTRRLILEYTIYGMLCVGIVIVRGLKR